MKHIQRNPMTLTAFAVIVALIFVGTIACTSPTSPEAPEGFGGEGTEGSESGEGGEGGESGEGSGGEPGESGIQWSPDQTADEMNQGAHLLIAYDASSDSFVGTVENTTNGTLRQVRVEVHLSNGVELGPTTRMDLSPGQIMDVTLSARGLNFVWFTVHPEVG